jgi:hypothetical protein
MAAAHGRRRSAALVLAALTTVVSCAGCSDDDPADVTAPVVTLVAAPCQARQPVLLVDLIDEAVAMVEAELGGPQQYFEIFATLVAVNVFVAVDGGTSVRHFTYVGGELTSTPPEPAQGNTFAASALAFDPQKVTSCVADELPSSTATGFEILGGAGGAVSYTVTVDSSNGGKLLVAVDGDGRILSVDPV